MDHIKKGGPQLDDEEKPPKKKKKEKEVAGNGKKKKKGVKKASKDTDNDNMTDDGLSSGLTGTDWSGEESPGDN